MNFSRSRIPDLLTWALSTLIIFIAIGAHAPWRDEAQAVMLVRDSADWPDLLQRIRWEGHPILWFAMIKVFGGTAIPYIHGVLASFTNALVVFRSNWPKWISRVIPFTYFFIFEYAVVYRNYAVGILLLFLAVHFWKERSNLTFTLLLLATQANFFAALIAGFLCILLLWETRNEKAWFFKIPLGLLVGVFLIYQLTPPETGGFANGWSFSFDHFKDALGTLAASLFLPFTLDGQLGMFVLGRNLLTIIALISGILVGMTLPTRATRVTYYLFTATVILFCSVKIYGYPRHIGHIWMFFLLLLYLSGRKNTFTLPWYHILYLLLAGQLLAGTVHILAEVTKPFGIRYSQAESMGNYLYDNRIPPERTAVFPDNFGTAVSLTTGQPYYLPISDTVMTHIIWSPRSQRDLYPKSLLERLQDHFGKGSCYLITPFNMKETRDYNPWDEVLQPTLIESRIGSISGENLYLFEIDLDEIISEK